MNRNQQGQGSGQGHYGRDQRQRRGGTQQGQPSRQQSQQQGGGRQGGRQAMQQGGDTSQWGARPFESMAEVALRGTALLFDLQMETARNVFRTQARTAAMLGVPDCSDLFEIGESGDGSLAALERRERAQAKAQGDAAFRNEPFVRELVERFSATVRPDSVTPLSIPTPLTKQEPS